MSEVAIYCVVCGKETELVITPDMDCAGIPVCEKHTKDVKIGILIDTFGKMSFESYLKKLKKRTN